MITVNNYGYKFFYPRLTNVHATLKRASSNAMESCARIEDIYQWSVFLILFNITLLIISGWKTQQQLDNISDWAGRKHPCTFSKMITVEPLTNDHPHQRPSLSYDHISCDGQWFLFVYESLTSDHPSYTTTPMWFWWWSYKRGSTVTANFIKFSWKWPRKW